MSKIIDNLAIINSVQGSRIEYIYDPMNQLLEERYFHDLVSGAPDSKITYQYDLRGNIKQKSVQGGATDVFEFDVANQITKKNGIATFTPHFKNILLIVFII